MFRMFTFFMTITIMAFSFFANPASASQVVFRLDDIQDYYLDKAQEAVMEVFADNDAALSIGVISDYFGAQTDHRQTVYEIMAELGEKGEVTCHSVDGDRLDLDDLATQNSKLSRCKGDLEGLFVMKEINTLIPPENEYNNDTVSAMFNTGYSILSSQCTDDKCPHEPELGSPMTAYVPVGVTLSDWSGVGTVRDAEEIFNDIQGEIDEHGWATVMMHPQEFDTPSGVDSSSIAKLEELVHLCQQAGYDLVTFTQLFNS